MKIIKYSMRKMKMILKIQKTINKKMLMAKTKKKIIQIIKMNLKKLKKRKRKQKKLLKKIETVV